MHLYKCLYTSTILYIMLQSFIVCFRDQVDFFWCINMMTKRKWKNCFVQNFGVIYSQLTVNRPFVDLVISNPHCSSSDPNRQRALWAQRNCQVIWTTVSLRAHSPLAPNQENRARPPDRSVMSSNTSYHCSSEPSVWFEWFTNASYTPACKQGTVTMCARCQGWETKLWHTDTAEGAAALRVWWHCGQDAVGGPCGGEKTPLITQRWLLQLFN